MKKNVESKNIWLDFLLRPEGKEVLEAMKEKNLTDEEIMELTGLSLEEINE